MNEGHEMYEQGRAAMKAGRIEDAIRLLQGSAIVEPHFKAFELIGECLMKQGRHAEAVGPLAAAVALNRGVRAPSLLAESLYVISRMQEAREIVDLALQRDPTNRKAKRILQKMEANQASQAISAPGAPQPGR